MFRNSSAQQLAAASSLIAIILSKNLNLEEINVLGNFIASIGATLLTIAAQLAAEESQKIKAEEKQKEIKEANNKK
ncbi:MULTISPECIES: hypothetical protein [Clostridium]|uniref:Uncharacterized protein n=1 Tax=Clostridium novyi (strain NT) TaxID=386415 RepID=A0Q3C6_CLONN|nr:MULTISPECIES: hypothetical protein [Clostridium]ABK62580.1 hypothetical protein NT01CX_0662 [Clostridium novyi NT]KEH86751.1 hypothetical protein Z967_05295 [Clostridium novyi A str. 4540]KEH87584.1 hypothetical protein Z966_11080 [Clostridium novyi A str. NCTC 538]KEH92605.1 hypothetical protein Z963_05115 [Clostridium botulinum C/D str. It1]KEH92893.1 hypothetical protein Z964_04350 [Clostridium novyi A str. GD211209]